ncbi:PREDICTED: AP-5 complex subunit zeta-1 [Erythranthe guttata]|uniref:AP-5 complex subunit zeta-1 n=1 Tax=Erythranthe guttata TaxID=4155 RepID=UPI00064E1220|nr:PREDICTED: AP-5 complex subunit zeta-1 [Erythranthe guttata]|eukprot:XP_012827398.1 PREDICTED: AP-5 complex subunit zeta-1 [Erythranthe guttata]
MADRDKKWDFHLRSLSSSARDSNYATDPASDPSILNSVKGVYELCRSEKSEEHVARIYPQLNKIFQRCVASISQTQTSNGLLLLAILQFFLDFGDRVLHDAEPSLRTFFRSCLSREFADPVVAEATLEFLSSNKIKHLKTFASLLPQFFPLMLKLIAWNGEKLENLFLRVFSGLISPGSLLPLLPALVDLPILVVALEKVEKSSGSLVGSSIASIQKSAAPEMLLALMDEAYTGSTIADGGADSESEDNAPMAASDPLFLDLLKDENDGLAERHWTTPAMSVALQAVISTPLSNRLKEALKIAPRLLDSYFALAVQDANDSLICALIPLIMARYSTLFPDKIFSYEVQRRLLEFMLAVFHQSPHFIALLKKPIVDRLGEAYDNPTKTELALQLCWAVGEYGGGGGSHKDEARELFESLELLLYENLSSRYIYNIVTSIAIVDVLVIWHNLDKFILQVARSRISDPRVWKRAQDYLGLMSEPAICLSILGPSNEAVQYPGTVDWTEGRKKMIAHIPFHLLGGQEGPPFHDFSFSDILPRE